MSLYNHQPHEHTPKNVNDVHAEELQSVNDRIAIALTKSVGSMWCAYTFIVLAVVGLLAILGILSPLVALLVAWASQTLIQLTLLPIIMVGQNVLNRKQELQADEQYERTKKMYHDIEQIMLHLDSQDTELVKQSGLILQLLESKKRTRKVETKGQVL
jgi:uncharacterized membrane protein